MTPLGPWKAPDPLCPHPRCGVRHQEGTPCALRDGRYCRHCSRPIEWPTVYLCDDCAALTLVERIEQKALGPAERQALQQFRLDSGHMDVSAW